MGAKGVGRYRPGPTGKRVYNSTEGYTSTTPMVLIAETTETLFGHTHFLFSIGNGRVTTFRKCRPR